MSEWVRRKERERDMEWEREQQKKNKNKQRAPFRSNPQTHHSVWHDDTSLWPEYSYRTSPASHRCIIHTHTETHKHTSAGSCLHCYQAFISLQQILLRVPTHIHSQFPPPLTRTHCKDFLWSLFLQADRYQTAMSVFYCQGWSESLSISKP